MPFVERSGGGATIWYEDIGEEDDEPVLLIHGGLMDPMNGERFWIMPGIAEDLVASGFRVIIPDRRYHAGQTTAPLDPFTWDIDARDIATATTAAEIVDGSAHVIAGSNGCSTALRLALRHPERVRSLTLCWPSAQDNARLLSLFEISAAFVEDHGPEAYLERLKRNGVPGPGEERPGFPFGVALLRDRRLASVFAVQPYDEAADIIRQTAASLLSGDAIRGMSRADMEIIDTLSIPISILPATPEDPSHTLASAESLARAIPSAVMLPGTPVSPSPRFAEYRGAFVATITTSLFQVRLYNNVVRSRNT